MSLPFGLGLCAALAFLRLAIVLAGNQSVSPPAAGCVRATGVNLESGQKACTQASEEGMLLQTASIDTYARAETDADFGWGPLSHRFCDWAFDQKQHVFHGMFPEKGWINDVQNALSNGQYNQTCWEGLQMNLSEYLDAVRRQNVSGLSCIRNWNYPNVAPVTEGAAMILGNDPDTVPKCHGWKGCSSENMVRLTLGGEGMYRWNMCRNFEFVACGAMGALQGQNSSLIYLATAPTDVWPDNITIEPQESWLAGKDAYKSEDMAYLMEVCLLDKMCSNHDELFSVKKGSYFQCAFDEQGYQSLKRLLGASDS